MLDLHLDARELQLRTVAATLELAEAGRLLDECPPLLGLRDEDLLDPPLRDDRVALAGEAHICEELDDVGSAHTGAVDEVLAVPVAMRPADDGELGYVERAVAGLVVEEKLDLAPVRGRPVPRAGVEDVVRLFGAQLGGAEAPRRPHDRVGDVRLSRAVRADDHGNARLEAHLDRVRERLEPPDLDRAEIHEGRSLTTRPDATSRQAVLARSS